MAWVKKGNILNIENHHPLAKSHASNPTVDHLYDDVFRIYFSSRDHLNRSSIFYADIEIENNFKVKKISKEPVIKFGQPGMFDDCGASVGWILNVSNKKYLYYLGWNLCQNVPWRNSIGLAISEDGETYHRYSDAPVLDRNHKDPISLSYPCVMKNGDEYHMWYGSNLNWGSEQTDMAHLIKYASSADGISWKPSGEISVPFQADNEYAMSKPSVLFEDNIYKMWYSYRGDAYRIGYAESKDGISFQRKDSDVGISVSETGWDSQTVEYPNVFIFKNEKYMLYNGNLYGKTGFGIAKWED